MCLLREWLNWLCKYIFSDDWEGHAKCWSIDRSEGIRKESPYEVMCVWLCLSNSNYSFDDTVSVVHQSNPSPSKKEKMKEKVKFKRTLAIYTVYFFLRPRTVIMHSKCSVSSSTVRSKQSKSEEVIWCARADT